MSTQYNGFTRILHWSMALLIIANISLVLYSNYVAGDSKHQLLLMHRSLGVLILELAIVRIIWMLMKPAPAMPSGIPAFEVKLDKILQHSFYLLMLLVPFSGFFMTVTTGKPVSFFGLFDHPMILEKNQDLHEIFKDIHEITAWIFIILIFLHIAVGIKHRIQNDGVFERIWLTQKKIDFLTTKLTKD